MNDHGDNWHLDKRVPIALIVAIVVQTFAIGWWVASENARVTSLENGAALMHEEITKLETARESTALQMQSINDKIDQILAIVKVEGGQTVLPSRR